MPVKHYNHHRGPWLAKYDQCLNVHHCFHKDVLFKCYTQIIAISLQNFSAEKSVLS